MNKFSKAIPTIAVLLYATPIFVSQIYFGSYAIYGKKIGIDCIPYFVDLNVILKGIDCFRSGLNPYLDVSNNYNYPSTWQVLIIFPFLTSENLIIIGIVLSLLTIAFLLFFGIRLISNGVWVYSLAILSPSVVLGIERGNCDLVIFLILGTSLFLCKGPIFEGASILIAALLKLYPIGAVVSLLGRKTQSKTKYGIMFSTVCVFFAIAMILLKDSLQHVSSKTPRPFTEMSYGLGILPHLFLSRKTLAGEYPFIVWILFLCIVISSICLFIKQARVQLVAMQLDQSLESRSFLTGGGIFCLTCLIGFNWEYRLIFLIFTLPKLLQWCKQKSGIAFLATALTLLVLWQSGIKTATSSILEYTPYKTNHYQVVAQCFVLALFVILSSIILFSVYLQNKSGKNSP